MLEEMPDTALDRKSLLTHLRDAVWGNQSVFKRQLSLPGPGTESFTLDYFDFGDHFAAVQAMATTLRTPQFLVRGEYRQAFEAFQTDETYGRGACIMGQPGIGKSCFIAYGVIELLRKEQPVAVQVSPEGYNECYALFSKDGVSLHPGDAQEPLRSHKGIWAFSDSNADVNIPANAFRATPNVRVFQTTSPKIERWKEWTKQNSVRRYIMNVWSSKEIAALATLSQLDVERMSELATKWGRVPRTLLDNFSVDQEILLERSMRSIASEAIPQCRHILRSMTSEVPVDPGPSSIFFIKPENVQATGSRIPHVIYIPTEKIAEILGAAVCAAAEEDRHDFFNAMIGSPGTRDAAGYIFEMWIHTFLSNGNTTLECSWHPKQDKKGTSILPSAGQVICTNDELRTAKGQFYWRPPPDFPGIDGALIHEKDIYVIQITIKTKHKTPQPGLDRLCHIIGEKKAKKLRWSVLFIGNKPVQSQVVSKKYLGKLFIDPSGKGVQPKKFKAVPVGWCTTSPVHAELTVLKTLTDYPLTEPTTDE